MTNKELLDAAKNWTPTEEDMKKLRERLEESGRKRDDELKITGSHEFLNRVYSL